MWRIPFHLGILVFLWNNAYSKFVFQIKSQFIYIIQVQNAYLD